MILLTILLYLFVLLASVITIFYLRFLLVSRKYWKNKNIRYEEPNFPLGCAELILKRTFGELLDELYFKFPNERFFGVWLYMKPALMIRDLDLVKNILIKDFAHFHDRGMAFNSEVEPLTGHLFNLKGQKWRNLRVKLTPTFTSGKMKMMYDSFLAVGHELQKYLDKPAEEGQTVEIKEIVSSFATDIISSVVFGLETKSFGNPDSDFRKYGRMIFEPTLSNIIQSVLIFACPSMQKYVSLRTQPKVLEDFFLNLVKDVVCERERTKVERKDFMQLLIELKNKGRIEDADTKYTESSEEGLGDPFGIEEAAAQAFVFFFAGFETSSTTITFTLYELAKHPEIQTKLQEEMDGMLKKDNGEVKYNSLLGLEYLDNVIAETLRKYPPVPVLFRECTKAYRIPGTDITIDEGTTLIIPISGIQNDPQQYPNPQGFQPERFAGDDNLKKTDVKHLAFGDGPRVCIGERFGLLQVKVGLLMILSKYKVSVAEKTPIPLILEPKSFVLAPKGGMPLKLTKR